MGPPDPEEVTAAAAPAVADIPPQTRPGAVHLTVADLDRSIGYYESAVGLRVHDRAGGRAALGTGGEALLVLFEEPGARPAGGFCGLYHFALLVPERADLARWLAHAARERVPLVGLSDHFVSEAIYLSDPDEHGIEIYWDRPREHWEGQVADDRVARRRRAGPCGRPPRPRSATRPTRTVPIRSWSTRRNALALSVS
jgi:catechol 2,3-dioxygenase